MVHQLLKLLYEQSPPNRCSLLITNWFCDVIITLLLYINKPSINTFIPFLLLILLLHVLKELELMAVNSYSSSAQISLQKYGSFMEYTNKELMSKRCCVPQKTAPVGPVVLRITSSIKNKVNILLYFFYTILVYLYLYARLLFFYDYYSY